MADAIINGLSGLTVGVQMLAVDWRNGIMLLVGFVLLYLGIKKDCEPLLLVPIGFGCILVNIPLSDVMSNEGFIRVIYDAGITTELFPLLIFVGIGAMTDFGPVLAQPSTFLLGAAGQFGIFLTLLLASVLPSLKRLPSGSSEPATVRRRSTSPRSSPRTSSAPCRSRPTPTCRWCRSSSRRSCGS
jgi:Na+-transporting methylmalonyl-CoA/oxaloacetate decarboxylase beta subunit